MEFMNERARERVVDDFATVLRDVEDLLKKAGQETGDRAHELRAEAESKLLAAKYRLRELEDQFVARSRAAAKHADDYVHESPWMAIGVAAAVGFVAGLLLNRR
jgi:ElaB/YqjD/DUF883 family membrane-anchored ribosome-binding protein